MFNAVIDTGTQISVIHSDMAPEGALDDEKSLTKIKLQGCLDP